MLPAVPPQGHGWFFAPFVVIASRPRSMSPCSKQGRPLCDPVELVEGNQTYSVIRLGDGQESTVSPSDLVPYPRSPAIAEELPTDVASHPTTLSCVDSVLPNCLGDPRPAAESPGLTSPSPSTDFFPSPPCADVPPLRWSTRVRKPPDRLVIGLYNFKGGRM